MNLLKKLQKSTDFWFLIGTSIIFFLLRLPSFFEPYWYGDEGIYEVLGFGIRHGRLLYRDIWDNKPPLLYLLYSLFSGDQQSVKILSFFVGLFAITLFFFLAKKLFTKNPPIYLSTALFALALGLPLIEGNIANAENFMVLPSVAAALLVLKTVDKKWTLQKSLLIFGAGILLGLSFLIKVVAVFDFGAFCLFLLILRYHSFKQTVQQISSIVIPFGVGFIIPLLITIGFFATQGALKTFIQSAFLSNVGYVNYGNQFIIPQGLLIGKLLLLGVVIVFLFVKRKALSSTQLFLVLWVSFSLFSALFSQRPYTHYVLVLIASFSLFVAFTIFVKKSFLNSTVSGVVLLTLLFFVATNFNFYNKTLAYYTNFTSFVTGQKDVTAYQSFFDRVVPRDYALAEFINARKNPSDTLFIWGNSAQIYKLTNTLPPGRYTVAYHITTSQSTMDETTKALQKVMPRYVIILGNSSPFPYRMQQYQQKFGFDDGLLYEKNL